MYKQKRMVTASGSEIMCPCATPLGTYFPGGSLVLSNAVIHYIVKLLKG